MVTFKEGRSWLAWSAVVLVLVVGAAWYLTITYIRADAFISNVGTAPAYTMPPVLESATQAERNEMAMIALERLAIETRNHRSREALASRLLLSVNASLVGVILAVIGSIFIISRIETSKEIKASMDSGGFWGGLGTNSPGVFFALGGVVVIWFTFSYSRPISTTEGALYVSRMHVPVWGLQTGQQVQPPADAVPDTVQKSIEDSVDDILKTATKKEP